jgi:hypothetical protein
MKKRRPCANAACECSVPDGAIYCSEYCEQAIAQAVQRDYCQCEHDCSMPQLATARMLPGREVEPEEVYLVG